MEVLPQGVGTDFVNYLNTTGGQGLPQTPYEVPAWQRYLAYGLAAPLQVASNMGQSIGNLLGVDDLKEGLMPPEMSLAAPRTGGQAAADIIGKGLLPASIELALLHKVSSGALDMMGVTAETAPLTTRIVNDAVGFGALGSQDNATVGLEQTAEGAAYGALSKFGRLGRVIPAAALALGSKAFFDSQHGGADEKFGNFMGHDWTPGDVSAIAGFGAAMFPGKIGKPKLTDHFTVSEGDLQGPREPLMLGDIDRQYEQNVNPMMRARNIPSGTYMGEDGVMYAQGPITRPIESLPPASRPPLPEMASAHRDDGIVHTLPFSSVIGPEGTAKQGVPWAHIFDPEDAKWLNEKLGADVSNPVVQDAMVKLKLWTSAAMVQSDKELARKAFMQFFEDIGHKPNVDALTPELGEAAWQDVVSMGAREAAIKAEEAARQTEAQIQTARKGKIPDLPEYRRTEGGFIDEEVARTLGYTAGRAVVGGILGGQLPADTPEERVGKVITAATLFAGLPYAWKLVPILQKLERNQAVAETMGGPRFRSTVLPESKPVSAESLQRLQTAFDGREEARMEAQKAAGRRGKMNPLPEYQRTQGGGVANPFSDKAGLPDGLTTELNDNGSTVGIRLKKGEQIAGHIKGDIVGNELQIYTSSLSDEFQNKKLGLYLYDKIADEAKARGLTLTSDSIVSPEAARVYEALERRGYKVERDPNAILNKNLQHGEPMWVGKDGKPVFKVYPPESTGMTKGGKQAGFVFPELNAAIGRSVIGGVLGGMIGAANDDINNHTGLVVGSITGAAIGAFGPAAGRSIVEALAHKPAGVATAAKSKWGGFTKGGFGLKLEEAAGAEFRGSQSVTSRFLRFLDSGFGITLPPQIKDVMLQARGAGSVLLKMIDDSVLKMGIGYEPEQAVKDLTNKFLGGGHGVGTAGEQAYLRDMQPFIVKDDAHLAYAKFAIAGRQAITGLQRMVAEGVGDPKMRKIITASLDKYLTKSYRLFTDPKYQPSEESKIKLADYLSKLKDKDGKPFFANNDAAGIKADLDQHIRDVKSTRLAYSPGGSRIGEAIDQSVFNKRVNLSSEWKEFLGEIDDPTERIFRTAFKLRSMAEASRFFDKIASVEVDGVKQIFDNRAQVNTTKARLLQELQTHGGVDSTTPEALKLRKQIANLETYQYVEPQAKYGALQGKMVSRHVWDTLATYDSITQVKDPIWRAMGSANTMIKLTRTALSPVTVIRNIMTSPFFLAIGKGSLNDVAEAWKIIRDESHPLREEILRMGIGNVDQVKTELIKEFENITQSKYNFGDIDLSRFGMGKIDLDLAEQYTRRGFRHALDWYRLPDNLTRIATYLSARRRIGQELGKAINDPEVIQRATKFTNRYTMNYDALPPAIQKLREIPGVNLFISYTAEMARITKNLVEDVIKGGDGIDTHNRMWAMSMLAMVAAVPETLQATSEASLSDKDKADWEQAKRLMPDYKRTRYMFVTGRDPKTKLFHYVDFTPLIPTDSFNQMTRAIASQDWAALNQVNPVVGMDNSPFVNIVSAQATGKDRYTDFRKMGYGGVGDRAASIAREVLPPWFPKVGSEARRFSLAHTENADGTLGLTDRKTGQRVTPSDFWSTYFAPFAGQLGLPGARPASVSLQALQNQFAAQAKQDIAAEITYANQLLKMDLPPQKRQAEIDRTNKALEMIQRRYILQLTGG